jgi:ribosomal protein L29
MSKRREALDRIRDLPEDELGQAHDRARDELFRLKLGNYTNQVENTSSLKLKRREVARILTIERARALGRETQATRGGTQGAQKTGKEG